MSTISKGKTIEKGIYKYNNAGVYGEFFVNVTDYAKLTKIIAELPENNDAGVDNDLIIITPKTLDALCLMTDAVKKLNLVLLS